MSWTKFVNENIEKLLVAEGFERSVAVSAAHYGETYYRQASKSSRRGDIFADCLIRARQHALANSTSEEKKSIRKGKTVAAVQPGLL